MQGLTGGVVTYQADKNAPCAKRCDIAGDIAGAPDFNGVVVDLQNRRRRFGRNARDVPIDEIVEHNVADAKNRLLADAAQGFFKVEHAVAPSGQRPFTGIDRRDRDNHSRIS